MKMPATNQNDPQTSIELRIRTMRIIWVALLLSIGGYFVLTLLNKRSEDLAPNQTISLTLLGIGVAAALISFLVKNKLLSRAIEQQQVLMVQQAYVVAWAITEIGALFGLFDYFVTGNRYYYLPLIIAACGQLLHFPQREHVINAAFKNTF